MELRELTHHMRTYRIISVVLILVAGVAAFVFSVTRPDHYDTSISFAVNRVNKTTTQNFEYDGYYAIQAADLFSQTVVSWFSTPSVVVEMYQTAGLTPPQSSIDSLSSRFRTRKYSSQNIVVRYNAPTHEEADRLAKAIIMVTQERAGLLNQTADAKSLYNVAASTPVIVLSKPNVMMNTVVGLILGAILAVFVSSGAAYFRGPNGAHAHRD
jgi:capsular polysaccharide biosynthesis protein